MGSFQANKMNDLCLKHWIDRHSRQSYLLQKHLTVLRIPFVNKDFLFKEKHRVLRFTLSRLHVKGTQKVSKMNWISGARKHVRFQNNAKLQKEFFERKRLGVGLKKKKVVEKTPSQRRHGVSQDLLALQIVSKAGSDPAPERPVKKVDMSKFQPCSKRVQDVELGPLSPVTVSSKLNLHEMNQGSDFTPGLENFCRSRRTTTTDDITKKKENSFWLNAVRSKTVDSHSSHDTSFIAPMGPFHKPKNSSKSIRSSNNMPVKLEKETSNENLGKQQSLDLFTLEDFQITPLLKYEKPIHSPGHILCQARTSTPKDLLFASESASSLICRDSPTFQNGQSKFRKSTNRALDPGIQNINSQDDEFKFAHSQCHTKQTKFLNETYVEADEREKEINQTRYGLMNERHLKKTEKYRYKLDRDFQFSSPYVLDKGMTWGETEKTFQESYIRRESDSKMFAKTSEQVQISHHNIAISESPMYVLDSQGVCVSDSLHSTQNSLLLDEKNSANINALETSKHKLFNMKTEHIKNIWTKKSTRKKPVQEIYVPENMRTPQMECKFFKGTQILDLEVHGDEHNGKENCEDHIKNTEEIDEVFHIFQYPIFPALEENAEDDKERRSSSPKPAKEFPQSLAIDHDDMIAASTMSYMSEFWEKNKSAVYNPNHHSAKKPKLELWCSPTVTGPDVENKESSLTQERHLKQIGDVVQEVCQLDDQDMCDNMFSQDTDTANQDADLDEADIFIISLGYDQVENVPLPEDRNASADKTPEPKNPPSSATKSRSCEDLSTTEVHEDIQIKENAGKTDRMAGFASQVHSSCENSVYLDKNRGDIDKEVVEMHPRNIFNQYEISDEHIKLQTTEVNQDSSQNQSSYEKLDEKVNSQISKTDIKELHKSAKPEQLDDIAESVVSCANQNAFHQNYMGSENEVLNKTCIMFTTVSCSKTDDSTFCDDLSRPNLIRDKASLDFTKDATLYDGVLAQHDLVNEMNDQSKKSYTDMATSPIVTEKISRSAQSSPDLTDKYSDNPIIPRLEVLTQKTLSLKPISYYYRQLAMKEIKHVSCQTEILNPKHFELTSNEM